jgi:hypothetical protein
MDTIQKYFVLVINPPTSANNAPAAPVHNVTKYPLPDPNVPVLTHVQEDEKDSGKPSAITSNPNQAIIINVTLISHPTL